MKNNILIALLAVSLSSCMPIGTLYADVTLPQQVTAAPGNKMGKSSAISVMGLVALGDASVCAAKRNGRISTVSSVDVKSQVLLMGLLSRTTTIITGN